MCSGDGNWSGNIFDFYFRIIDRLLADVKTPFALKNSITRVAETPIHTAIREVLANCLIHADYFGRRGIVIDKEYNKITFSNPGNFRISIDEAIAGGISDARNGKIFNLFSLINVGERSGTGLCDLYYIWKAHNFKPPEIQESINPDRVTLTITMEATGTAHQPYDLFNASGNDGNIMINDGSDGYLYGNRSLKNHLKERELAILKLLNTNPSLSAQKIAEELNVSKPTIERDLRSLKAQNIIRREGSTRGKWVLQYRY